MKCFYHGDADGKCAAYWVNRETLNGQYGGDREFVEVDYSKPFPLESVKPEEFVWIVDFSISPVEMTQLLRTTKNVIWIDHHKTAIDKFKHWSESPIDGLRVDGISGCMLTYLYTVCGVREMSNTELVLGFMETAPYFTRLINDWDIWRFKYGDDTRHFQVAFNAYDFHPLHPIWNTLGGDNFGETALIEHGKTMLRYRDGWAKSYLAKYGFAVNWEGLKCFVINLQHCNSEYFKSLPLYDHDVYIAYAFNGKTYKVSLYGVHAGVDVSVIAQKYGGGGHQGAAGFSVECLPPFLYNGWAEK